MDAFFDRQTLPDPVSQYTAHNIAVLVQTVSRGLVYLITFIFGANTLGLAGEGRWAALRDEDRALVASLQQGSSIGPTEPN